MISVVILAAGTARRFGGGKLELKFKGKSLLRRVFDAAMGSKAGEVIVVLGHDAKRLEGEFRPEDRVKIVENPDYQQGMSTSLKAGISHVSPEATAAIVMLADQPLVDSRILDSIGKKYEESQAAIVAPSYAGRQGNPVLFDKSLFEELMRVSGDVGGRDVIARNLDRLALVSIEGAQADRDIDTREDYQSLIEMENGRRK